MLGTSTARSKIRSARSKICPLEERLCLKCSKNISLGFRSARYVLEKSCARARSARIFYARNARNALGIEHKKSIILDELLIVCSECFQNSPWPFLFKMTILSTISQNILVCFLLKVLPTEGTELNIIWIDIEYLVFFAATRHFAFFDGFHKISGLNSILKDEECFQRN